MLIAYGLRRGEVAGLRLDDLDWKEEKLQVRRPKPGRTHHYPLSRGVGQAIVRYLTDVRPPRPERTLFLTVRAPIHPLSPDAISIVVRRRLNRLGDHRQASRSACVAPRCRAAPARPRPLDEGGRRLSRPSPHLVHLGIRPRCKFGILREVAGIDLEGLA